MRVRRITSRLQQGGLPRPQNGGVGTASAIGIGSTDTHSAADYRDQVKPEGAKSTISEATSYREIGEFWDTHDLAEYWDETEPVEFEVDIQAEATYYALDRQLSQELARAADEHGVSPETLLNIWVQEKLAEEVMPTS